MSDELDFNKLINSAQEGALKKLGRVNILIAGKTGVGKSTLINSVFQGRMAETGQGRPVTQETREITKEGIPVSIFDTKGLELKDYEKILKTLIQFVETRNGSKNALDHMHVAWVCIAEGSRRVEAAEILLAKELSKFMPVVVVITTATSDQGFKATVEDLFPFAKNVVRVNSVELNLDEDVKVPVKGLDILIDVTMEVIPEAQKKAFAAAQKISMNHKMNQAHGVVASAAIAAAGIAAVPVPFSDAVGIIPIQVGMLAGVSSVFGLDVNKAFLTTLISGTFTAVAGTFGGRAAVGTLLKFFPGVGSVAGGAISATVAATITTAFGEAYAGTLYSLLDNPSGKMPTGDEVAKAFRKKLTKD